MILGMKRNPILLKISLARLRVAVAAAGTTNVNIALVLGMKPSTFNDRIRGRRRWQPGELDRLEQALGVSALWLAEEVSS